MHASSAAFGLSCIQSNAPKSLRAIVGVDLVLPDRNADSVGEGANLLFRLSGGGGSRALRRHVVTPRFCKVKDRAALGENDGSNKNHRE